MKSKVIVSAMIIAAVRMHFSKLYQLSSTCVHYFSGLVWPNWYTAGMDNISVDEYIHKCPIEARSKLQTIRSYILKAAPGATERTDYFGMPGYSYEGYDYNGMFAWFSYKSPCLRIHIRPPVIEQHKEKLSGYKTTKSIVSFPLDGALPHDVIVELVTASVQVMKDAKNQNQ